MLFLLKFDILLRLVNSNKMSDRYVPTPLRQQQQEQQPSNQLPKMPPRASFYRTNSLPSLPPRPKSLNVKSETDFPSLPKREIGDLTKSFATITIAKEEEWRPTTPEFGKFDCITEEDLKGRKPM